MSIREDAKKIAQRMVDAVSDQGTFQRTYTLEYELFADGFGLSDKRCQLCLEYLEFLGCIKSESNTENAFKIMPRIIDYVECDNLS